MSKTPRQEICVDYGASPWTWGSNTSFENTFAALMEAAPHDEPQASKAELQPLREAIAAAVDRCSPESRFVIEAHTSERLSFKQLAARLGVGKSQAHRIYLKALDECRTQLLREPAVRERLNMYTYWQTYVDQILVDEIDNELGYLNVINGDWLTAINESLTTVKESINYVLDGDVLPRTAGDRTISRNLIVAARVAAWRLNELDAWSVEEMGDLLAYKQSKYGHDNILDFGMIGVGIRACDKRARIMNLSGSDEGDMRDESVVDTLADVVGYAVISKMLVDGTFTSELEPF